MFDPRPTFGPSTTIAPHVQQGPADWFGCPGRRTTTTETLNLCAPHRGLVFESWPHKSGLGAALETTLPIPRLEMDGEVSIAPLDGDLQDPIYLSQRCRNHVELWRTLVGNVKFSDLYCGAAWSWLGSLYVGL